MDHEAATVDYFNIGRVDGSGSDNGLGLHSGIVRHAPEYGPVRAAIGSIRANTNIQPARCFQRR